MLVMKTTLVTRNYNEIYLFYEDKINFEIGEKIIQILCSNVTKNYKKPFTDDSQRANRPKEVVTPEKSAQNLFDRPNRDVIEDIKEICQLQFS